MSAHLQRSLNMSEISPVKLIISLGKVGYISDTCATAGILTRSHKITPKQSLVRRGTELM